MDDELFAQVWNESRSRWEVARRLAMGLGQVQSRAAKLRKAGVALKVFDKNGRLPMTDGGARLQRARAGNGSQAGRGRAEGLEEHGTRAD